MTTKPFGVLLLVVALGCAGCSFSYSSKSLSESSGSSSDSSSSSSSGNAERAYKRDVADYTKAFVASARPGDVEAFRADLGRLAQKHGIANWQANMATYEAIGTGLARAHVSDAQLLAFKRNLGDSDPAKMDAIQRGHDASSAK